MRRELFVILVLLCMCQGEVDAQYYNGYRSGSYTYNNGYWYYGNQPYTRTYYSQPAYYAGGCYYPSVSYYTYTPYYAPPPPPAPTYITYKSEGWREKLIDLGIQRDKFEGQIRKDMFEQAYFIESVKAMGLEGNFRWNNYGSYPGVQLSTTYNPNYSLTGHAYYNTYPVVNANTQYGYSYNQLVQSMSNLDINTAYLQAYQLAQGSQKLSSETSGQFGQLVAQAGQNEAKKAENLAKIELLKQVLSFLQNPAESKGVIFKLTPGGIIDKDASNMTPKDKESLIQQWGDHAATKCGGCHTGDTPKGGFQLESYLSMTPEQKQKRVFPRIFDTNFNSKTRMPRLENGEPGPLLTEAEKKLWLLN